MCPLRHRAARDVLVQVAVCGVCRTDLDLAEGRLVPPRYPVIPAHQIVGTLVARARFPNSRVCVFVRNAAERDFALSLGASWAGDTADAPPELLSAVIDTAPAWKPEREIKSVANVRRTDVRGILALAATSGLRPTVDEVPLEEANDALAWPGSGGAVRDAHVLRLATS